MPDVTPELQQIKARAEERLLTLPGVTGVDIGFKEVGGVPTEEIAIRVLVAEKKPPGDLDDDERVPAEIDGVVSDVIERRFELHHVGANVPVADIAVPVDAGRYDPLTGGISVGPCRAVDGFLHAGTLGAIVVDNATGRRWGLSNFHVLCVDGSAAAGDPMAQPSRIEGGQCPGDTIGPLRRHALTDLVDAAVLELVRGARAEVAEIGGVTGVGSVTLGQAVRKRGRTTRLTHGVVDAVDLTVPIDYGPGIGVRTLTGQIGVRPDPGLDPRFSAKGDSGSVVLNDAREVVGLLFGGDESGYGVANRIDDVLAAMDVTVAVGPVPKRVETPSARSFRPAGAFGRKDESGKELKFEKDEIKDQKFEAKEDKDWKDGKDEPDVKFGKDSKDDKDKQEKDEFKDGKDDKDKQEKDEIKDGKDDKDKQEKDEIKDGKGETKDEFKDDKDKEFKPESKDEVKEGKDDKDKEFKDEIKDNKDEAKDFKDDPDKNFKDTTIEVMGDRVPAPASPDQRIAALEATVARLTRLLPTRPDLRKPRKNEKVEVEIPPVTKRVKENKEIKENEIDPRRPDVLTIPAVERRVVQLEAAVGRLSHFIQRSLRPDLSHGALQREPDVAGENRPDAGSS